MLQYLRMLFTAKKKAKPREFRARLGLESFEPRDLPSLAFGLGHPFQAHVGHATAESGTLHSTGAGKTLTATLSGTAGSGQVTFTPGTTAGQNTLAVSVTGLAASQTYSVQVDGTSVGQVSTDASGNGSVTLSNVTATVKAGSVVSVVDTSTDPATTALSGTLAPGACHGGQALGASLSGTTGSGSATFHPDQGSLKVSVSGLTAGATYSVQVSSGTATPVTVGQITTDSSGNGKLTASGLTASITAGTTISVVDSTGATILTGTFSAGGAAQFMASSQATKHS
jgi:hypothetical protein